MFSMLCAYRKEGPYANTNKDCSLATDTLKGYLTQARQGVKSTKAKPIPTQTVSVEEDHLEDEEPTYTAGLDTMCGRTKKQFAVRPRGLRQIRNYV